MKKIILLCFLSLFSALFITMGCGGNEKIEKNVNCGDEINLLEFFNDSDSILNAKFFGIDGKEIAIENGVVYLSSIGEYKLVLNSGTTYIFSCKDLEGPIAVLKNQASVVYKGDFVNTDLSFVDRAGADVVSSNILVTFNGESVEVKDNKFLAECSGEYLITVNATDENGNNYVTEIKIESIETVYGKGIYVIPEQDDAGVIVSREKYLEGENAGKYRTVIRKDYYDTGFGYLTIKATVDAGLKPNTYYGLAITVDSEHDSWCYYNPDNEWLTKKSAPTVNFTVKTDEKGEFYKRWWTYHSYSSYYDFSSVTFHEYAYGQGIDLKLSPVNATSLVQKDEEILSGADAGKYIKTLTVNKGDFFVMNVSATAEANLAPNSSYRVNMTIDTDGEYPAVYEIHTIDGVDYNDWFIDKDNSLLSFKITTDNNGAFAQSYRVYVRSVSSYVKFSKIDFALFNGYVYGDGIDVEMKPTDLSKMTAVDEEITSGEDAGKLCKKIIVRGGSFFRLKINVSKNRGLLPEQGYIMRVKLLTDGDYPAVYEAHRTDGVEYNDWFIDKDNPYFEVKVTTDKDGQIKKEWQVYVNGKCSYVKTASVEFIEFNGYAYGEGIDLTVEPKTKDLTVVDELLDKNSGNHLFIKRLNRKSSNFALLSVSANKDAGLMPNSAYLLTITATCDGVYPAYYQEKDEWHINTEKTQFNVYVYTDDSGEFNISWNTYFRTGTYVKFTAIDLEHINYAYPLGVYINPNCSFGVVEGQEITEGVDVGKKVVVLKKDASIEGASKLTISAVKQAGLKANTTYTVRMRIDTDKDSFWAYYCTDNAWLVKQSEPYAEFEVTTDENGEFEKLFNKVYFGKNCTYAKFSEIIITEK